MANFSVPARGEVSERNQAIFDDLKNNIGFVPNMYAYIAKNDTALGDYLTFKNRKSTLNAKEREVINLVTSQINACNYCQSAHTMIGKMNGFSEEQIIELRTGEASFDSRFDALVKFAAAVVNNKGRVGKEFITPFLESGYTEAHMIDVVVLIGDKIISNYIHNLAGFEIDFPLVAELS